MKGRRSLNGALELTPQKQDFILQSESSDRPPQQVLADQDRTVAGSSKETLVPLTTRLRPATAQALRRAYLEQKLAGKHPDTQQEIVEAALHAWLAQMGFMQ